MRRSPRFYWYWYILVFKQTSQNWRERLINPSSVFKRFTTETVFIIVLCIKFKYSKWVIYETFMTSFRIRGSRAPRLKSRKKVFQSWWNEKLMPCPFNLIIAQSSRAILTTSISFVITLESSDSAEYQQRLWHDTFRKKIRISGEFAKIIFIL